MISSLKGFLECNPDLSLLPEYVWRMINFQQLQVLSTMALPVCKEATAQGCSFFVASPWHWAAPAWPSLALSQCNRRAATNFLGCSCAPNTAQQRFLSSLPGIFADNKWAKIPSCASTSLQKNVGAKEEMKKQMGAHSSRMPVLFV